ncbi:MAG: ATP-binding protein [Actinomycetota bacterium]|nr:ATP-binding protein [Actinomycetota bacterium]
MPADAERRTRTASVRFRVTAAATIAVLVLLALTSLLLVTVQRRTLTGSLEEGIDRTVDDITSTLAAGPLDAPLPAFGDDDAFAQVDDADGRVLAASPNLEGAGPVLPAPDSDRQWWSTAGIPVDDSTFRTLSARVDGGRVVHAGATLDDIDESVALLSTSLTIAVLAVSVLLAGLVWVLVGRTLRPVEAIRREVAAIGGGDLHRRVSVPPTDDEVSRLARTMNDMLGRVERAAERQKRFVSDASHELRSPLTRMRSELEVDLAHPSTADARATHRSVLDETVGLQQLVDDLLVLTRGDAARPVRRETVDLSEIVRDHARRVRESGCEVDEHVAPVELSGDPRDLDRAIGNVAANAASHARSRVAITLDIDGDHAIVRMDDDGPGVPVGDRQQVFERFTRLDDARTARTGGAGLGLAIAHDVVARHGGTITVDDAPLGGARFEVRLPIGPRR